jgi:hypothetical protein
MLPAMPQELSDMIIDFLHNDVAALCTAGLVCKSWLQASRFHLFSKIRLCNDSDDAAAGVPRLLELICADGSTIPPYILRLSIQDRWMPSERIQFVEKTLLRLPLLSNLKILRLSNINMASLTPNAKKRLNIMLRNLTSLELSRFTVRNCFSLYLNSFYLICDIGTV